MVENLKEWEFSRHNVADACMNSKRLWQHAQDLHKLGQTNCQNGGRAVETKTHPSPRSYSQMIAARRGEIFFFSGVRLKPHSRSVPMLRKSWSNQSDSMGFSSFFEGIRCNWLGREGEKIYARLGTAAKNLILSILYEWSEQAKAPWHEYCHFDFIHHFTCRLK